MVQNQIIKCARFTILDNLLISRNYPPHLLDEKEWLRYLHLQAVAHCRFGTTTNGLNNFKGIRYCTKSEFEKIRKRLIALGLIKTVRTSCQSKYTTSTVLMTPLYDRISEKTVHYISSVKTGNAFEFHKIHFTIVPSKLLHKALRDNHLSLSDIRVLLKLYRYNNLNLFHGVDCNVIRYEDNEWYVHPRLLFDLYMDRDEFLVSLHQLMNLNYILVNKVAVSQEDFDVDTRLRVAPIEGEHTHYLDIITPIYQYVEEGSQTSDEIRDVNIS